MLYDSVHFDVIRVDSTSYVLGRLRAKFDVIRVTITCYVYRVTPCDNVYVCVICVRLRSTIFHDLLNWI